MNDPCASSSATEQQLSRLEKERARKHAKRAHESLVETENRKRANREKNSLRRASESEAECVQRLAAGQQREPNHRLPCGSKFS